MSISRPIFIIIACILLALVFGGGLVWPKYQELRSVKDEIEFKEKEFSIKEAYFSNINQLSAEIRGHRENILKIDSALPEDPSVPSFLNFIQGACSQTGMLLESISQTSVSSSKEGLKEVSTVLQVRGTYSYFKNFLSVLEKSSRLIETEGISFSSSKDEKSPMTFKLTVKAYSY